MKRKYPNHVIFRNSNFDFDVCNAISATDCTGLIPWAPNSEDQLDAYDEIVNYSPESANIYNYTFYRHTGLYRKAPKSCLTEL